MMAWLAHVLLIPVASLNQHPQEIAVPAEGQHLPEISTVASSAGILKVTLRLGPVRLTGPGLSVSARAFNASVPGPSLAVRPGDRLVIRLENHLSLPLGPAASNSYQHPNTSNLHVHGLHVSPLVPADNVLDVTVNPGKSFEYDYQLPRDHSPGIYWIHPHGHGSLTSQTGAAAALLVLDPPGYMSPQVQAMRDHVLVLQNFPREELQKAAHGSHDQLFHIGNWTLDKDLWLVNGAPKPVLTVQPGVWHRVRFVVAGIASWLSLSFEPCKVALLAKDGIYIQDFPRYVQRVQLPPGGRAQVVLNCPGTVDGSAVEHCVWSSKLPGAIPGSFDIALGPDGMPLELFKIRAEGPRLPEDVLQPWAPSSRPAYLRDLTRADAEQRRLEGADMMPVCSCPTSMGNGAKQLGKRWVSGHSFEGPAQYLSRWPQDAVVERRLSGIDRHPFHQHTWPFQLFKAPKGGDPYFQAGDWHDTYANVFDGEAIVRFSTTRYAGPQVIHCHANTHSDEGMIGVEWVGGHGSQACACGLLDSSVQEPGGQSVFIIAFACLAGLLVMAAAALLLRRKYRAASLGHPEVSEEEDSA